MTSTLLETFLGSLGLALLERSDNGAFQLLAPAPDWFRELFGVKSGAIKQELLTERSPFLEGFFFEADAFWEAGSPGSVQSEPWVESLPGGKQLALQAVAHRMNGKPILVLSNPESHFRERTQTLQVARNALLEHERLFKEIQKKEILLHCIVHDLSQPLSAMRGSLECLAGEELDEHSRKFVDLGRRASEQQESMIREILQTFAADLQASAEPPAEDSPDLLAIAREAHLSLLPAYEAKGVHLQVDTTVDGVDVSSLDWPVHAECTRLRRVFSNLLENSLRYSPPGSTVTIRFHQEGEFLRAMVDDEGPGLPADLRPAQIFALFSKGKAGGGKAGLGLYFCRITVERWGGSIGCSSLPDLGSRFWFRLPKSTTSAAHPSPTPAAQPEESNFAPPTASHPLNVLLADDQDDIRMLTAYQLGKAGHHVLAVANGREAVEAARTTAFDVVLLDDEMPVLSGALAASRIREFEKQHSKPLLLVALTGNDGPEDQKRLKASGFDAVLGKPFHVEELLALISKPVPTHSPAPAPVANGHGEMSEESLLARAGGDPNLLRQMIRAFLHDLPGRMKKIQKAIEKRDADTLANVAHALKGSLSIFQAVPARECAERLQNAGRREDLDGTEDLFHSLQEEIAKVQEKLRVYAGPPPRPAAKQHQRPSRKRSG